MKTLNLGTMVHHVTIQRLTDGVDNSGAPQETWATLTTAWMARRQTRSGRVDEQFTADQLSSGSITEWTMRYLASMDPDIVDVPKSRRLLYLGRAYDILTAENMDRKVGIVIRTLSHSKVAA
jgi:head-tail adaptor